MNIAKASLARNEETFRKLCKVQQILFFKKQQTLSLLIGSLVVLLSLAVPNATVSLILLFFGCWFIAGAETPPMSRAKKMAKAMNPNARVINYSFEEKDFSVSNGIDQKRHDYRTVRYFVDDGRFLYLFRDDQTGFMIDKGTVYGLSASELSQLILDKTGARVLTMHEMRSLRYAFNALLDRQ